MGEVRAGRDLRLHRKVAVKLLRGDMAAQPMVRERFEAEARSAARLVHPHVVAVFDSGEDAGTLFLVMERLVGRTLADAIEDGPMDPGAVRELGVQILDALAAAHAAGLIHRDIKPANVLSAGQGSWKVGDFGIAKSVEVADPALTSTGLIIGTPAYLAPERLAGGQATAGGDLYAVGVVLYEALTGRRSRDLAPPMSPYGQPLPPLDGLRPGLPPDLVAAVTKAMDPDPAARFGSAHEMAACLEARALDSAAPPAARGYRQTGATQILRAPMTPEPLGHRVGRSLRRLPRVGVTPAGVVRVAGVLIAGVALAAIVAISLRGHQSTSTPATTTSQVAPARPAGVPTTLLAPLLSDALNRLEQAVKP